MNTNIVKNGISKEKITNILTVIYFAISGIEIMAEFLQKEQLILLSKPLIMPLLILLYFVNSKKINLILLTALFFVWMANMLFISKNFNFIIAGSVFFTIYRIFIIYLVIRYVKFPSFFALIIGCLPFLFIYLFVINLAYEELAAGFWLFLMQGIFTIFFGGLVLGNYIFKSNSSNTYLLISTMLFTFTQFLFVIRLFYTSLNIFQPLAMLLYVIGQYLLYKFVIIEETKQYRQQNINKLSSYNNNLS